MATQNTGYKRPVWQWILIYVVIAGVVYGVYYYMSKNNPYNNPSVNSAATQATPTLSPTSETSSAATATPGPTTQTLGPTAAPMNIAVTGTEFSFSPPAFSAKAGQLVKLTFTNNGQFPHNLSFPALNVATKTISAGESDTISFTPDKAGTFDYICTVPGHADRGMKGTLTVQ